MRTNLLALASLLAATVLGCDTKGTTPDHPANAGDPTLVAKPEADGARARPATIKQPARVIFSGLEGAARTVGSVLEDGSAPAVTLSRGGVDTVYAGAISGRRALLVEHAADGSIASLVGVRPGGEARATLATLPPGEYRSIEKVKEAGDVVVVELRRRERPVSDVLALRPGSPDPKLLGALSTLAAVTSDRVALVTKGNLTSVKLDGTGAIALGGGDGRDEVVEARGDLVLLTTHAGPGGDVRLAKIAGGTVDIGKPDAEEKAFALTASRVVYQRKSPSGAVIVSVSHEGADEQILAAPELDATPVHVAGDRVLFASAKGGLFAVGAGGGAAREIDPNAGAHVRVGAVTGDQVVYTSDAPHWPALRVASLDGSKVVSLVEEPPSLPFFAGLMPDGRLVYYRALAGQIDGGRVFSVKLDGTDRRPIGTSVSGADGVTLPAGPADQDFEAITPSGRLILESEFESVGGSQLLVGAADSQSAKLLPGASHVRFVALID